jgi:adenosine deaminase
MNVGKSIAVFHPDIPVVDLHRHMDGNVRLQTMIDLARQHNLDLPAWDVEGLRSHVQVTDRVADLKDGLSKFAMMQSVMVDYDACRRIAWENLEDAVREGIDYVELRFSPLFMAEAHRLDPISVASVVCEVLQEARGRLPVQAKLIVILSRHYGPEACQAELDAAIAHRDRGVVAVDLAGVEDIAPGSLFVQHYRKARDAGLRITAHAGEWSGVESVRQAVLELGAERLGHAVAAARDPAAMDLIAERGIAIESCPTSNVQFSAVPSYLAHPLPVFLRRGLLVTVNTDDPGISGIDLPHEYRVLRQEMGLAEDEVRQVQANGVQAAFLSDEERTALWRSKQAR